MSEHPFHALFQTFAKVSNSIQTQLSNLIAQPHKPSPTAQKKPSLRLFLLLLQSGSLVRQWLRRSSRTQRHPQHEKGKSAAPLTKEELGRSTWTFLHTLAAQYPDKPTRQQKKDVKELILYIRCMFGRSNPVQSGSYAELSQWLCHVHNTVNRWFVQQKSSTVLVL
ncbi:FAD-linked sulfhydryl oxidase ERV1-like [Pyrus ussuriensis x Pyrus communis]|uniref:Sulfhydryl oxidase n=1 Tax=Pyrus ussuriensis x Pyrus communis TaxID=2448454 RepID=A0A5N5I8C9_9ROSA|nr:FAD-linked sulfhydryl oxidase ERV1-like [Pyrus ussuriensis x Pyrus communis]